MYPLALPIDTRETTHLLTHYWDNWGVSDIRVAGALQTSSGNSADVGIRRNNFRSAFNLFFSSRAGDLHALEHKDMPHFKNKL